MDLKVVVQNDLFLKSAVTMSDREIFKDLGLNQNAINASNNIYLLSERGYCFLTFEPNYGYEEH